MTAQQTQCQAVATRVPTGKCRRGGLAVLALATFIVVTTESARSDLP